MFLWADKQNIFEYRKHSYLSPHNPKITTSNINV